MTRYEHALDMHLRAGQHALFPGELVEAGHLLFDGKHLPQVKTNPIKMTLMLLTHEG